MRTRRWIAIPALALLAACGGGGDDADADAEDAVEEIELRDEGDLIAQVASYELEVETPQRFLVGLITDEQELVGFGDADLAFSYLGTEEAPVAEPEVSMEATATYALLPGQEAGDAPDDAQSLDPDDATGVYRAQGVVFDRAGFWRVDVSVEVDGEARKVDASFEVLEDSRVVEVGEAAPRTVNHLPGAQGVPVDAVDSRAEDDGSVPDPELHELTVADAIAAGRPTVVVVSTPVYCVSRFCGPITDEVAVAAERVGDAMSFVHLEVWRDFEGKSINKAAAEWIYPDGAEGLSEPWVFVVGADGTITHRFDNVTSADELEAAIDQVSA